MLKKVSKRPKPYRMVLIFIFIFLLLVEMYTIFTMYRTVNVSSFDVEIATNKITINESKKTFSIGNQSGSFIKTSKEYKEVLAYSWSYVAVIDTDNQLKIIDLNESVVAVFKDFTLDTKYITATTLFEGQYIIRINFVGNKEGKYFNIDYCYNKNTKETYLINNS